MNHHMILTNICSQSLFVLGEGLENRAHYGAFWEGKVSLQDFVADPVITQYRISIQYSYGTYLAIHLTE